MKQAAGFISQWLPAAPGRSRFLNRASFRFRPPSTVGRMVGHAAISALSASLDHATALSVFSLPRSGGLLAAPLIPSVGSRGTKDSHASRACPAKVAATGFLVLSPAQLRWQPLSTSLI